MTRARVKRQTEQRRDALLRQVGRLFWEYGYDKTSMRDIARACGYKPPNIYNYFPTKEQLLFAVIQDDVSRVVSALSPLEADVSISPAEQMRSFFRIHMECIADTGSTFRLITDTELKNLLPAHRRQIIRLRDKHDAILRAIIKRGRASGDFVDVDEKIVGYAIASMIIRSRIWFSPKGRLPIEKIADMMCDLALYGLTGRPLKSRRSSSGRNEVTGSRTRAKQK